jgi:hypothetical protein
MIPDDDGDDEVIVGFVTVPDDPTGDCVRPRYFGAVCGEPE